MYWKIFMTETKLFSRHKKHNRCFRYVVGVLVSQIIVSCRFGCNEHVIHLCLGSFTELSKHIRGSFEFDRNLVFRYSQNSFDSIPPHWLFLYILFFSLFSPRRPHSLYCFYFFFCRRWGHR